MASINGTNRHGDEVAARQVMVREQLERRDITDPRVVAAMREVPRHLFVPPVWRSEAYSDRPLPIDEGQTISQPYMVAIMLQLLALQGNERVLEIGTGSGYQTAVLSRLAAQVYSLEYFPALAEHARGLLHRLGYSNVQVLVGDGGLGLPVYAPYDGIIVAAAAPRPPAPLLRQLAEGGRLVIPVGTASKQEILRITKQAETYQEERGVHCRFVPLLGVEGWEAS
jgi:protein-L-isoaspartate(D-aspartate) O-methyltransferase